MILQAVVRTQIGAVACRACSQPWHSPEHGNGEVVHQEAQAPALSTMSTFEAGQAEKHATGDSITKAQAGNGSACQKMKNPDAAGWRSAPCGATAYDGSQTSLQSSILEHGTWKGSRQCKKVKASVAHPVDDHRPEQRFHQGLRDGNDLQGRQYISRVGFAAQTPQDPMHKILKQVRLPTALDSQSLGQRRPTCRDESKLHVSELLDQSVFRALARILTG